MGYFEQQSTNLDYRKARLGDIEGWREFFIDNPNVRFLGLDPLSPSLDLSTSWINKQIERYQAQGLGLLAVIERESGQLVGMAGIIPRNIKNKDYFEIAYSMKPSFQRKGYATEAAMMMKQFGVMNNLSSSFISMIHPENYSSIRVAEKNGMSYKFDAEYLSMSVQVYGD